MPEINIKEVNRLAIPAIIAGIAEPIISIADTAIIGHLGTAELGGVGIATSFFLLVVWILAQTKSAISAIVSRYYGQNNTSALNTLIPQAILLNFCAGIIFYLLTNTFSTDIFQFYEAKGQLLKFADAYFSIRSVGFAFTLATFATFGIFRGLQNTSWAMQISIAGGTLNVLLDILLVYGIPGIIPSFGVEGAAFASLVAQFFMFLLTIYYLLKKTDFSIRISFPIHPELRNLIKMSTDLFARTIALNIAYYLGTRFSTSYGKEYIAAHTIALNIWLFSSFFIDGYSNAGNALAGRLFGEENFKSLYKLGLKLMKINLVISIILALVFLATYPVMGGFFTKEPEVLKVFNMIFWMVIICQPINSIAFTFDGIYKGLGRTALLRNVLIGATLLGFTPVILLSDYAGLQIYGVWLAFITWMVFRGAPLAYQFVKNFRQVTL